MPKTWTADSTLMDSLAGNLCEAAVLLPRHLVRIDELVHRFKLPFSHIQMLVMLSGGDTSISDLSRSLGIAKPNITPLLDHLSERGLLERVRSDEDRRIVNVHLTSAGQEIIARMHQAVQEQIASWEERFSRSEIKRLNSALASVLGLMLDREN